MIFPEMSNSGSPPAEPGVYPRLINSRGSIHIISTVILFLIMMGAWSAYHSWQRGDLEHDVKQVITECRDVGSQIIESIKNYR